MRQRIRPAEPPNRCRPACVQDNRLQDRKPFLEDARERRWIFYQKYPWEDFPDILSALPIPKRRRSYHQNAQSTRLWYSLKKRGFEIELPCFATRGQNRF